MFGVGTYAYLLFGRQPVHWYSNQVLDLDFIITHIISNLPQSSTNWFGRRVFGVGTRFYQT